MTADPYARLDGAYLLGALDAYERLAYEEHLATCERCQAGLAEISAIPALLAGLDNSVFAAPPEVAPTPVRRRRLIAGLGLVTAACAVALIALLVPSTGGLNSAPRAMTALIATPIGATITLQSRSWGTEIDLTCWYRRDAAEPSIDQYELVAHGTDGVTYDLGSWRLVPGQRVVFISGIALAATQVKNLEITQPNGRAILALRSPATR